MMIGNVSDAYNDYKIYPYALGNDRAEKDSAVSSSEECQTCKNRKYQDGSDEMVSFKKRHRGLCLCFHPHLCVSGMWKNLCFRRNNEYCYPLSE